MKGNLRIKEGRKVKGRRRTTTTSTCETTLCRGFL
jgi:hypothetical protein